MSLQGFNSGLVLFNLEAMRTSPEYNIELTEERMVALSERYPASPSWSMGDQDWLTLLAWDKPHLVLKLPCRFNVGLISGTLVTDKGRVVKHAYVQDYCFDNIAVAHLAG